MNLPVDLATFTRKPRRKRRYVDELHSISALSLPRDIRVRGLMLNSVPVEVEQVPLNFGGERAYFRCPVCDRRSLILYSGPDIACRKCHGLAYESENVTDMGRALAKSVKQRRRLGQVEWGLISAFPDRPKGMHATTYSRVRAAARCVEKRYAIDLARKFGIPCSRWSGNGGPG